MKCLKLLSVGAALALAAAVLTGCGSSSGAPASSGSAAAGSTSAAAASADLDSVFEGLLAANPISNQFEIADMNIEYDFLLNKDDVAAYKGVKSNDNGDAGLVLVIEAADGKAQSIVDALEAYREEQAAYYGNYAEFAQAQENVRSCTITAHDNLVVMAIASSECTDAAALSAAASAALAS